MWQEPAEHDRVAESLLEVDEKMFVADRLVIPVCVNRIMFACAGKKPVGKIDPALFELSLQQQNLRAIVAGGGVVRVLFDHGGQASVCLGEVEFSEANEGEFNPGEWVVGLDGQGRFKCLDGLAAMFGLLVALAKVVPNAGVAGVEL